MLELESKKMWISAKNEDELIEALSIITDDLVENGYCDNVILVNKKRVANGYKVKLYEVIRRGTT